MSLHYEDTGEGMSVGEAHPLRGEFIEVRCRDLAIGVVAAQIPDAEIVGQDHDHVRSVGAGMWRLVEPRFGLRDRPPDRSLEPAQSRCPALLVVPHRPDHNNTTTSETERDPG